MLPFITAGVACIVKQFDDTSVSVDASKEYSTLDKKGKDLVIRQLAANGISQKEIAKSFGISPPAVSQRLKRAKKTCIESPQLLTSLTKLADLSEIGFSNSAIASLLQESNQSITKQDIASFLKVQKAVTTQLQYRINQTPNTEVNHDI